MSEVATKSSLKPRLNEESPTGRSRQLSRTRNGRQFVQDWTSRAATKGAGATSAPRTNTVPEINVINRVDALTESQKVCLRLVARGMTSKEIALETGLSPQTVDTYLKSAMARLAAPTRRAAARILAENELSQNLGSPPAAVAEPAADCEPGDAAGRSWWLSLMAPPPLGGSLNELSQTQRGFAVLKVAAISTAVVLALTLLIAGALQTFR